MCSVYIQSLSYIFCGSISGITNQKVSLFVQSSLFFGEREKNNVQKVRLFDLVIKLYKCC